MGRIDRQQVGHLYRPKRVQGPIKLSQSSSPLLREEIAELLKKRAVERVRNSGTRGFYSWLFLVPKKNGKLCTVIDLSLLNQYINKQHFKMETVKSVRQLIMANDWAVSIDLTDAYLHVPIHAISRKYLRFVYDHRVFQFMALRLGMSLSQKLLNVIATHLRLHAISLFPYLDDWLIRDLICNRLTSHTKCTLQTVQNLGLIPNLKKSDLIPTQQFTFIGIEFLTQQKIVRVPADRVKALILTIKTILSQTQVSAQTFFSLLGKLSAAADFNSSRQIAYTASAPLYSTLHNLRFDMQHDYVCIKLILDPLGPHPPGPAPRVTSKFRMCSSSPHP